MGMKQQQLLQQPWLEILEKKETKEEEDDDDVIQEEKLGGGDCKTNAVVDVRISLFSCNAAVLYFVFFISAITMGGAETSKELLHLEHKNPSTSSLGFNGEIELDSWKSKRLFGSNFRSQ
ncbi:hypothetical protein G4B88_004255 [Cannabis sativa]|uniref:Uncharacterized protein n=1 Tax=Cannabis sativa TaxID=3483 RepID=A0A7J6F027_CANSA|nr:hypothetical protein G4B88_004255 [Cannabis sativa]